MTTSMSIHKIGNTAPHDLPTYEVEGAPQYDLDAIYNEVTGMEYVLHRPDVEATTQPDSVIIEACHEDVGLVTYYRADSYDEAVTECNSTPAHLTSTAYRPYEPVPASTAIGTNQTANVPPADWHGVHEYKPNTCTVCGVERYRHDWVTQPGRVWHGYTETTIE